jgi:hypothetical protein
MTGTWNPDKWIRRTERRRRSVPESREVFQEFARDDPGHPLGPGVPLGGTLRVDGDTHREAWMRVIRRDPCSFCSGPGGTVDHIEPRAHVARGIGGVHSHLNFAGACLRCNGRKGSKDLLAFLLVPDNRGHTVPSRVDSGMNGSQGGWT